MQDRGYLLNVAGLDAMEELVREKLDEERLKKFEAMHLPEKRRACAGAGLLIQWALQKAQEETSQGRAHQSVSERVDGLQTEQVRSLGWNAHDEGISERIASAGIMQELSLMQLLSGLQEPIPISYTYGAKGKPYFQNVPLFFNLSHSEDYVVCVVSEHEVGVDIQKQKPLNAERISNRFFHEREKAFLAGFSDEEERSEWFYRLWTRKEAYGKMTGEGVVDAASKDFSTLDAEWMQGIFWEEYSFLKDYKMACCRQVCDT